MFRIDERLDVVSTGIDATRELPDRPGVDARAGTVAERLRALADPIRLRLLGLLGHGDCPVGPLAAALGIGQSLISFHLAALRDAGLLTTERVGRFTYARLRPEAIATLLGDVTELVAAAPGSEGLAIDEHALAEELIGELAARFAPRQGIERVRWVIHEEIRRRRGDPTGHGLPSAAVLIRRHATERLRANAQADGYEPKPVPELLFVCVHNAGRSQMAAALTQQLGGDAVHAWSAGSQPAPAVHDQVTVVMAEVGIDLADQVQSRGPTSCSARPTSWSPWAAGRTASSPACGIWPGTSPTRPVSPSTSSAASVTT